MFVPVCIAGMCLSVFTSDPNGVYSVSDQYICNNGLCFTGGLWHFGGSCHILATVVWQDLSWCKCTC